MTEPPAAQRIGVVWSFEARADLRAIDRDTAMQILRCVDRYLATRSGDVKKLRPPRTGFRLRWPTIGCSSIKGTSRRSALPAFGIGGRRTGRRYHSFSAAANAIE